MKKNKEKIQNYKNRISSNMYQIRKMEDDIEQLKILKSKLEKMKRQVEKSSEITRNKIFAVPNMIRSNMKLNIFSNIINYTNGTHYNDAIDEINSGIYKIQNEIEIKQNNVSNLIRQNNVYDVNIHELNEEDKNGSNC